VAKVQAKLIYTGISRYFMDNNCGKTGKLFISFSGYVLWHRNMNSYSFPAGVHRKVTK
jgi:hypothetical protein